MLNRSTIRRIAILLATLVFTLFANTAVYADSEQDVEKILREIHQDQPVPKLDYLKQTKSINADSSYYQGRYNGIKVAVETHPNSTRVASILLSIEGPDQTRAILPAVIRVLGPPKTSDPKNDIYGWSWPGYRTASVHNAPNGDSGTKGMTTVSIFYR